MSANTLPLIGITLGDPAGIGPEVVRGALASGRLPAGVRFEIIGSEAGHVPGQPTEASARAAIAALESAAGRLQAGGLAGVVTGPVCKSSLHKAGYPFPGQTEFFAERAGTADFAMCLTGGGLTVALVTAHVPLRDVFDRLRGSEIISVGRLLLGFLRQRGIPRPRIAVAGLNPHAGEHGDLGREEIEIITPAIHDLERIAPDVFTGPYPPDTVFHRAACGEFDAVLCMYHDQGLIPLKLHAFDSGVNVTLGLPFVRTSPDHGTAFPIAGKGTARHDSMLAAIHLAAELVVGRAAESTPHAPPAASPTASRTDFKVAFPTDSTQPRSS
jgi:4-hydroxythreonine-4-phosphate dehydrogenase